MFNDDIVLTKEVLNEFQKKVAELIEYSEKNKLPPALVWGMLSFGFTKVANNV